MWHDFFQEKPEIESLVLWYLGDTFYGIGFYEENSVYKAINFEYENYIWEEQFNMYKTDGVYWHELPEPPEKPKEAIV